MIVYPSLDYELNSQVRKHREANGYTQEEFAFLIGRDVADVIRYEDLTTTDAYDFNHINRYARVLHRVPRDFVFEESLPENDIKIEARKTEYKTKTTYRGERQIMIGGKPQWVKLEPYSIPNNKITIEPNDFARMVALLDKLLIKGYFRGGVTGYDLFVHVGTLWSGSFRPKLLIEGLAVLSGRRKRPKLLPMRKAPKTEEKWILYKEDIQPQQIKERSWFMGLKPGPKRIATSTGKPDRRQRDNKDTPGNTPSLKPSKSTKKK